MNGVCYSIAKWIRDYRSAAGKASLVVGMSGGIDSAVVAALCNRSRNDFSLSDRLRDHGRGKPPTVICVSMPMLDNNSASSVRAKNMCNNINCEFIFRPIGKIVDECTGTVRSSFPANKFRAGNFSARIRTAILYDLAAEHNGLVVGTCNKDEIYTGYFTKGGDGMSDIEPIGDLHKRHVRLLAKELGVTQEIIDATPSAELWDGQTDEGEMGVTYDQIEWVINHEGWDMILEEHQKKFFHKVQHLHNRTEHKRNLPPIFKVTS